jgi:hypothetical protein
LLAEGLAAADFAVALAAIGRARPQKPGQAGGRLTRHREHQGRAACAALFAVPE